MSPRHAQTVHDFYDALARGDLDAAGDLLTPDAVLHVPGRSSNTGDHVGRDAVIGFVAKAAEVTRGTLRLAVNRVLADEEQAVALATYTATRPDRATPLVNNVAHVITLRDGRIAESWLYSRDQYEVDAFWGELS
ncbi:nuclear transport factor 2 family protein [Nonomuraea glycinis]|uniref:Ketosteroid isomerase n=1 Tax=Nonomuraea glycinis TaxID=2047744 RepID=A0A918ABK5_9ACTN|nr:nuclear transport factor 2 family protein [Nonomuraea glycinis]MCA2181526.1 nuclear transport factor 2 family protein [Nonomuraea glycinis]GGP14661.1 ketosteroid isomerase [Nonomuraea glycinis]